MPKDYSYTFTATGPTTIKFLTGDSEGPVANDIDNISVEAVPEPTTMTALALGALAMVKRRRTR
ncbi:MAG: PEP-CTERM sorting domain-containing protein [Fimbriimonas sp.]